MVTMVVVMVVMGWGFYVPWTYLKIVVIFEPDVVLQHEQDVENQSDLC